MSLPAAREPTGYGAQLPQFEGRTPARQSGGSPAEPDFGCQHNRVQLMASAAIPEGTPNMRPDVRTWTTALAVAVSRAVALPARSEPAGELARGCG